MQFSRVLFIEKKLPAIQPGFFGFQCRLSFIGGLIPFDTGQPVTDNAVNVCLGEQLFALSPAGLRGGSGGLLLRILVGVDGIAHVKTSVLRLGRLNI